MAGAQWTLEYPIAITGPTLTPILTCPASAETGNTISRIRIYFFMENKLRRSLGFCVFTEFVPHLEKCFGEASVIYDHSVLEPVLSLRDVVSLVGRSWTQN